MELKPCPFCEDKSVIICNVYDDFLKCHSFWVECRFCEGQGPKTDTEEKAIKLWNERTRKRKNIDYAKYFEVKGIEDLK